MYYLTTLHAPCWLCDILVFHISLSLCLRTQHACQKQADAKESYRGSYEDSSCSRAAAEPAGTASSGQPRSCAVNSSSSSTSLRTLGSTRCQRPPSSTAFLSFNASSSSSWLACTPKQTAAILFICWHRELLGY